VNRSDREPDAEWPIRPDNGTTKSETTVVAARKRGINPIFIALGGLLLILLGVWLFTGRNSADQDKLSGNEMAAVEKGADPAKVCASKSTYDAIKRELFRRAAQVRGSDQAAFANLAGVAVLRMENPVLENPDSGESYSNCSGSLSLDLPPGVAVVGGRTSLTADVDYRVQRAADNSGNVVVLGNADAIVTPLATITRVQQQPTANAETNQAEATAGDVIPAPQVQAPDTAQQPTPPRPVGARPSFDCDNARTKSEIAVCSNAGLAALDRTMSAQYGRAIANASPDQRAALQQTRDRFLRYRDRCPNNACIGDAYTGRMREIRDIMEGNWEPR